MAASEGTSVPAFEDIEFPDSMPASPTQAEDDYYDYDDMSVHYDLSFETYSYGASLPDDDPIKAWLEKKYNVTLKLETVATTDQQTFISTAFASGDAPDVITLDSKETGFMLGEQGLLVDGKDMYPYMPQTRKFVTNTLLQYSTMDDEMCIRDRVCTAGTSDIPVAEEAALTAEFFGSKVDRIFDVGVAGIHRLISRTEEIREANCVIAVAGMEGARGSVVAGLVENPVIAVPTSVGYGASFGGVSALLTMLNSCAEGMATVNIDNGFGAGYMANQINHLAVRANKKEA